MIRFVAAAACLLALSGCAMHPPPPASRALKGGCFLPVVKLTANQFDNPDEGAVVDTRRLIGTLADSIKSQASRKKVGPPNVLVLSGGSLHGAFGAGLLYGWMSSAHKPPTYDIVTGVSTGALQSTFIFLATSENPDVIAAAALTESDVRDVPYLQRRLGQSKNGVPKPGSSWLANLAHDYMPDRESDLLHLRPLQSLSPNKAGMLELIGNTSVATMAPLRDVLKAELGDGTLKGVAIEARAGRKLYVAIADLVNGYGYAADLTRLAELADLPDYARVRGTPLTQDEKDDLNRVFPHFRGDHETGDQLIADARQCYIDALVASSSVPPGVAPPSIGIIKENKDGRILDPDYPPGPPEPQVPSNRVAAEHSFIDGGAAFAVFFSQLHEEISDLAHANMDLIVNGTYFPAEWDKWLLKDGRTTRKINDKALKLASLDYVLQSAEVLQTQVRLFSVQEARRWERDRGRFRWAFIDNRHIEAGKDGIDKLTPWQGLYKGRPIDWKLAEAGNMNCQQLHEDDKDRYNPMEFFPRYMQCLLNYGVARGQDPKHRWNMCILADLTECKPSDEE